MPSMRALLPVLLLAAAIAVPAQTPGEKKQGFMPLFDGKTLNGWDGDPRLWKVVNGVILGSTEGVTLEANSFLISKQEYADFHLKVEVKLRNHNSGIQFRSEALPNWVVRGLQADMAFDNYWGSIYDEKGKRGIMVNGWNGKAEKVVRQGDWNECEVICDGDLIQIKVNGLQTAELHDTVRMKGVIALQMHRGPAMQVEFRNLRLKKIR
jgi:hypothetical protein